LEVTKKIRRFDQLDGLRGISCLMVLIYHLEKYYTPEFIHNFFLVREGYIFVDVFFVISGFVIAHNYNSISSLNQYLNFIKKRFKRLYPLLFFSACFYLIFYIFRDFLFKNGYEFLFNFNESQISNDIRDFFETILLTNSSPLLGTSIGVNSPSWSISAEMICYIFFGALTIINKKPIVKFFTIIICVFILINISDSYSVTKDYGFIRAMIGFNCGNLVYGIFKKWEPFVLNFFPKYFISFIKLLGLSLFLLNMFFFNLGIYSHILNTIITPIILSLFILSLVIGEQSNNILTGRTIQYLGTISYSFYLNHLFFLIYFPKIFLFLEIDLNVMLNQLLLIGLILFSTIFFSKLTYQYIEKYFYPRL
jgi:peptidoglycan/LPS O-acetylase OafA/YrhL